MFQICKWGIDNLYPLKKYHNSSDPQILISQRFTELTAEVATKIKPLVNNQCLRLFVQITCPM